MKAACLLVLMAVLAAGCSSPVTENGVDVGGGPVVGTTEEETLPSSVAAIDYAAYAVKYYPPGEPLIGETPIYEDDSPFTITGHGPVGYLPSEIRRPAIYVTFSQPVVPLAMLGKPATSSDVLTIEPPLSGSYRWYGTRLFRFDAVDEVIPQREYIVGVNPSVMSLGGKELTGTNQFSFRSEPLAIEQVIPGGDRSLDLSDVPLDAAANLVLVFNHPVNADVVTVYIEVLVGGVAPVAFTFDRRVPEDLEFSPDLMRRALVLRVRNGIPEDTQVDIVLRAGARSEADYIGAPADQHISISTIGTFSFINFTTDSWTSPRRPEGGSYPVFLEFTHPVDPKSLIGGLRIRPETPIPRDSISTWENRAMIADLPFSPESTYTLIISGGVKDTYGRELGDEIEVKVTVPEARRYAYFPNTGTRILEARLPHRIAFEYQNVFEGVWKIGKISDPYSHYAREELRPYDFSDAKKNQRHFEVLELDPWLNEEGTGSVGIAWNFAEKDKKGNRPEWAQDNLQLQVTDLALTTRIASNRILVLVSSLSTGRPVPHALVALMRGQDVKLTAETGESGLAIFELRPGDYNSYFQDSEETWRDHLRIRVVHDLDSCEFIPNVGHNPYQSGVYNVISPLYAQAPRMETLLFTDRGLYRPGDRVWFRGIDLDLYLGEYQAYEGRYTVEFRESGYQAKTVDDTDGVCSSSGGLYGFFDLPQDLSPGYYVISYMREDGQSRQIYLQVAFFDNLIFQVDIEPYHSPAFLGDTLQLDVHASYLAGGDLAEGPFQFYWSKEPSVFSSPTDEWQDYRFGPLEDDQRYLLSLAEGSLDAGGRFSAEQPTTFEGVPGKPYTYQLEARVQDAGHSEIAARERVFVHPASFYIAARLTTVIDGGWSSFVPRGEEVLMEWNLVDPDGKVYQSVDDVQVIEAGLYRVDWMVAQQQGVSGRVTTRYEMVEELESSRTLRAERPGGSVSFRPERGGLYRIKLTTRDDLDRAVVTAYEFYATGSDWIRWGGESSEIGLEADSGLYAPGETATILIKSPLPKGTYLVTVEREGIFEEYLIDLEGSAQAIGIPVLDTYVPVVYVSVASYSIRSGEPSHTYFTPDLDKPKGYYGVLPIYVDTSSRRIDIDIQTEGMTYLPGGKAEITVRAAYNGRPVSGAEITFLAVDRGVVDRIDYSVPDPLHHFYSENRFPIGVRGADSRSLLIDPVTYEARDLYGGNAEDDRGGSTRSNFIPTAVFEPFLVTDSDGVAKVAFTLPDNLTTYRCTAVAVDNGRFGYAEEELRVQQPINMLSTVPKRIRVRDTIIAGVLLTNMDRSKHEISVSVESDLLEIDGESLKTTTLEPGQTVEVTFDLYAERSGETEILFTARSEVLTERLIRKLVIDRPSVREIVITTGRAVSDDSGSARAVEGIRLPGSGAVRDGAIEIEVSPSLLAGMKTAMSYLVDYPHGCFEQRASRIVPLLLFEEAAGNSRIADVRSFIAEELILWAGFQLDNGGFPFWPEAPHNESYYATLRIAHVLKLAEERGFAVPAAIDRVSLLSYLAKPDDWVRADDYLSLYSLYIQALYGGPVRRQVAEFAIRADDLDVASLGFLGLLFHELKLPDKAAGVLEHIVRYVKPGTRSVDLTPKGDPGAAFYGSEIEQLSLLLLLQTALTPEADLTDRVAGTLLQLQHGGFWRNTASTNWVLLAFASLMEAREEGSSGVNTTVTLDGVELLRAIFQTPVDSVRFAAGLDDERLVGLKKDTVLPLELASENGSLYYTASLAYELPAETAGGRDEGFSVYTVVEETDGTEHKATTLTLGRTYRCRVVISTSRARHYVALRVPVPSGVDILDSSFTTTGAYDVEAVNRYQSIEKILENEVRYYFDRMEPGSVEIEFLFRATSRGVFPTPPATAECMYEPEVFGRSRGTLYIVRE